MVGSREAVGPGHAACREKKTPLERCQEPNPDMIDSDLSVRRDPTLSQAPRYSSSTLQPAAFSSHPSTRYSSAYLTPSPGAGSHSHPDSGSNQWQRHHYPEFGHNELLDDGSPYPTPQATSSAYRAQNHHDMDFPRPETRFNTQQQAFAPSKFGKSELLPRI